MTDHCVTQKLQNLALFVGLWLCAACTSTTGAVAVAPQQASCQAIPGSTSAERYAGCVEVVGDLRIEGSVAHDLSQLAALRRVTGTLFVGGNPNLKSLEGLEQLEQATDIVIVNNPELRDVSSLVELEQVDRISIAHNPQLEVLSGANSVKHLESLTIMKNGLTRVKGFDGLKSAGQVSISDNSKLIYITGLAELSFVEDLVLDRNPRLAPSSLLKSLAHVDGKLSRLGSPGIRHADLTDSQLPGDTATH